VSPAEILAALTPGALKLAVEALGAILAGDWQKAARKAEEAGRRQATRLTADTVLAKVKRG